MFVHGGQITLREGIRPEGFEPIAAQRGVVNATNAEGAERHADRKKKERDRGRIQKRIAKIGDEIAALEAGMHALDEKMIEFAADYAKVHALMGEREGLEGQISNLWAEWEELEADG